MKTFLRIMSYILTAMAACCLTLVFVRRYQPVPSKLDQLESLILEQFIGEADQTAMEDAAADAMVKSLGDRWSHYIPAANYAAHVEQANNAYVGIGITIQKQEEEPKGLLIVSVSPGGSAEEAGLQPRDIITAIEGQSTAEMTTEDARNLVRGEEGTTVALQILRGTETLELNVTRKQIMTPVATGRMLDNGIGLIRIANFDSRCAQETIEAIEALTASGAKALIFDLRYNPGGYATELVKVLDYLLPEGKLFQSVDWKGRENVDTSDAACLDIPMAVIVNQDTYSAAEFFAAALQEYGAGVVVGTPTCGKGYFQYTLPLSDGSAVGLSVGKYFTPKGNSLIGTGVIPDAEVPVDDETAAAIYFGQLEPKDDPQIQAAVEALEK